MDVSAITSGTGAPAPDVTDQTQASQGSAVPSQSQPSTAAAPSPSKDAALTSAISKLFAGSSGQSTALHVSYRVDGQDIVTVFSDPKTGKEVAQFPAEILLGLAKFFDHQGGVTLDQTA